MRNVILLEFNEICPPLLERWIGAGRLPNFAAFYRSSQAFTTFADDPDPVNLEPWIQWYSIHTGLPYHQHQVFHLTDGPKAGHPDLWHELHRLGKSVMNCSSMNAQAISGPGTFFLPDPWCIAEPAYPAELETFKAVVGRGVQEYSRGLAAVPPRQLAGFLAFLSCHGLSAQSVGVILRQLARERLGGKDVSWRRVALLDLLQLDVFRHYYRQLRPDFATFFVNSTAHLQHAYWRHMDPGPFSIKPSAAEQETYGDAVLFGYQAMDRLLQNFMALAGEETVLILCSALSQQPFLTREDCGGQHFFRLRDPAGLCRLIGITPVAIEPIMTHMYMMRFADRAAAERAAIACRAPRLGDRQVFAAEPSGDASLCVGCQIFDMIESDAVLSGIPGDNGTLGFFDALYPIDAVKSARHHPEGVLWIRCGGRQAHREPVSILDIAPTVCELLGAGGATNWVGDSLVPRFAAARSDRAAVPEQPLELAR
ncbi:MAG TPA: hypothetical protein VMF05_02035 [Stellaceae bacterium]|nr:hypothetical protein [Stellaceae bacterium]